MNRLSLGTETSNPFKVMNKLSPQMGLDLIRANIKNEISKKQNVSNGIKLKTGWALERRKLVKKVKKEYVITNKGKNLIKW